MTTHSLQAQSLYRKEPAKHRFVLQHTPTRRACPTSPPSLVRKRLAPQLGAARILATIPPACDYHCVMKSSWQPASIQLQTTAGMHQLLLHICRKERMDAAVEDAKLDRLDKSNSAFCEVERTDLPRCPSHCVLKACQHILERTGSRISRSCVFYYSTLNSASFQTAHLQQGKKEEQLHIHAFVWLEP